MGDLKRGLTGHLDTLIAGAVPGVRRAVKGNISFYDFGNRGWFLSFHCFTKYIKVAVFRGVALRLVPPRASKSRDTRTFDNREGGQFDEARVVAWMKQASKSPGVEM